MKVSAAVSVKGKFFSMNLDAHRKQISQSTLSNIGNRIVTKMKEYTNPYDWMGELTNSISWVDSNGWGNNSSDYPLEPPSSAEHIYVGSAVPYAYFREFGAGPHLSPDGSEEFKQNMILWYQDKIGGDPENDSKDSFHLFCIMEKIRVKQDAVPFAKPVFDLYAVDVSSSVARNVLYQAWKNL